MDIDASEVLKNIEHFINGLPERLKQPLEQACLTIEGDAKKNCPVDNGILRASITHDIEQTDTGLVGYVGTNIEYAPFVEMGTGIHAEKNGRKDNWTYYHAKSGKFYRTNGMIAKPFLRPAIEANRANIISYFSDLLKEG
ncbi:MAG: HK97 gp10 family phage protein [Eubacteriales bacterium]|nr:HK97 gp10 family phage protein [Eubacteriales bacterium]